MDNRKKEDNLNKSLKRPMNKYSVEIGNVIDSTIRNGGTVYLCTDWHLWIKDKEHGGTKKRSDFQVIINNYCKRIKPNDLVINLGDLVDGEFTNKNELANVLKGLPGKKIHVRGNNDIFDVNFYKNQCGFLYSVDTFVWNNIIFSHMPIENAFDLNVHGHIHNSKCYWVPYSNMIDVASFDGRKEPVKLLKVIRSQPLYAKRIKEAPEHFDEQVSLFVSEMRGFIPDPFTDDEE